MEPEAADLIVDICRGEPFLFQLAGQEAWYAGAETVITAEEVRRGWREARSEAITHVEQILARLPGRERELIDVMAGLNPRDRTLTRISRGMGFTKAAEVGAIAQRLDTVRGIINRGKLYTFRHRAVEAYLSSAWPDFEE